MAVKANEAINSIKMLTMDMLDIANIEDKKVPVNIVPLLYSIYSTINIIPSKPNWLNRDRFICSIKEVSAALYATLYYFGYDYSLADLKRFSDIDSFTPYNPELNVQMGIECTCGLPGEAIGNATGFALGERYFENICDGILPKSQLIDYYTYILCTDIDLQAGVSYESLSFASAQNLNNLVLIYLETGIQNDGDTNRTFIEDIDNRFEDLDFNIIRLKNHNNISSLSGAIKDAKKSKNPTIIIVPFDLSKEKEITKEALMIMKQKNNVSLEPFEYSPEVRKIIIDTMYNRMNKTFVKWQSKYDEALQGRNNLLISALRLIENGEFIVDFDSTNYQINEKYAETGVVSNKKVINFIAPKTRFFLGGSADNFKTSKTIIDKDTFMLFDDPLGRNIEFGYRLNAMGAILNGIALNNIRVFGSTYLSMAGKLKESIKMSTVMNLPVTYIFTHDRASLGKFGPAYIPVDEIAMLRNIPQLNVFRPADINEIIGSWEFILKNKSAAAIILNNEVTPIIKHTNGKYVKYGAYIVRKEKYHLDGIIVATGAEVNLALKVCDELFTMGIDLRIVSMPSVELFTKQNPIYEEKLLPQDVPIVTLEFGNPIMWNRFATDKRHTVGVNTYGYSGKPDDVLKLMEFDYNAILMKIKNMFDKE